MGGGTGGHFYPLIAIAEALRERDKQEGKESEIFYLGPDPYNQAELDRVGAVFVPVPAGKNRLGYGGLANFFDLFKTIGGIFVAFWKLLWLYPDAVMSKGGYTSVPVVLAAGLLRIPIVIHESDAVPGRANLLAAAKARYIAIAHQEVAQLFNPKYASKISLVGMPIRSAILQPIANPFSALGIPSDKPIIAIMGGSSGAERLNDFVLASLPRLLPAFTVLHLAGDAYVAKVSASASTLLNDPELLSRYFVMGHLSVSQMAAALQAASLVITRAGSTALFEIAYNRKPAIVIPIPEDVSRDQRSNAYAYARATGAVVLEEHNLSDDILVAEISRILSDQNVQLQMSAGTQSLTAGNAAYTLADTLRAIAAEH